MMSVIEPTSSPSLGTRLLRAVSSFSYLLITFSRVFPSLCIISGAFKVFAISSSSFFSFWRTESFSCSPPSILSKRAVPILSSMSFSLLNKWSFSFSSLMIFSSQSVATSRNDTPSSEDSFFDTVPSSFSYFPNTSSTVLPSSLMSDWAFK